MLRAALNNSCMYNNTKQQLYGHLPPISQIIQVRRIWHAGHYWRNMDELISDVLQHIDTPRLVDQHKIMYISSEWTPDAV